MIQAFQVAAPILAKIEEAGFEAYFVGGSVRDYLLNKDIHDVDIATSATPLEIKSIFPKTIDVGIEHGTVVVLYENQSYEITTFRSESDYEDFRRPAEVQFIRSLIEDLQRRDFTINAIAMNRNGDIIDPFNGRDALERRMIATVGIAKERFNEDALRMMRAVRFVSQLSFSIESSTFSALSDYGGLLREIAIERISTEFEKLLKGTNRKQALQILLETEIYKYLPGFDTKKDKLQMFVDLSDSNLKVEELWVLLIYKLNLAKKDIEPFLKAWKLSMKTIKGIEKIFSWLEYRMNHEWTLESMYYAKIDSIFSTEKLYNVLTGQGNPNNLDDLKQEYESLPIKERNEMDITGTDLMEWFQLAGGPWVKEKLESIEKAIIIGEIENRKETIREWLMRCNLS
ncbi:CCA tRNA nucleotidyltransferase [Cytobacillus sp. FJAT-54145]|uniref:CCA-adding enzyme n=1 Tax=Cytobacillus spartinae TaxID=3299023 RepID=A0ABW6KHP3_9BACI